MKTDSRWLVLFGLLIFMCGTGAVHAVNVLQNPGFELAAGSYAAGWTNIQASWRITTPPSYVRTGSAAMQCNGWGEWGQSRQTYASAALGGQTVTASVWGLIWTNAIVSAGWNGAVLALYDSAFPDTPIATTNFITRGSATGVWVQATLVAELYPDTYSVDFVLQAASVPAWSDFQSPVYFDDAVLDAQITNVPSAPASVAATHGAYSDKVRVTWNASAGASTYAVYRAADDNSAGASNIAATSTLTYDDLNVAAGQTNYYWVKAGNSNGWSGFSASAFGYLGTPSDVLLNPGFESHVGDAPTYWNRIQASWWVGPPNVHTGVGALQCNGYGEWGETRQSFVNGELAGNSAMASVWGMIPSSSVISAGWNGAVLTLQRTDGGAVLATTNFITDGSPKGTWIQASVLAENLPFDVTSVDLVLQAASGPDWSYFQGPVYFDDADLVVVVPEAGLGLGLLAAGALAWRRRTHHRRAIDP